MNRVSDFAHAANAMLLRLNSRPGSSCGRIRAEQQECMELQEQLEAERVYEDDDSRAQDEELDKGQCRWDIAVPV